jgi:hypothetical protein
MRTSKHIEQLAHNIHFRPDEKTDERILAEAEAALRNRTFPATKPETMRIIIMRNPIMRIAVAAVVVIACVIGLSLWRTTGSGIALADVLARVEKVKAVRYKWTNEIAHHIDPDKPYHVEIRATSLNSREYGTKSNREWLDPNGGESTFAEEYFLPQKKMTIGIVPKQKKYTRKEWDDGWVERMQKANPDIKDPLAFLKGILKYKYESLGRSTMDGIEVEGFRTTDPNHWGGKNPQVDIKIWVDVKTRLPVRYDSLASEEVNQRGDKMRTHFVMHDFQWDVSVAAADFEPVIPEDYTGTVIKYPAHITEETAIQGLKVWVELLGKYPEKITRGDDTDTVLRLAEKSETPAALRLKEEIKGLTDEEIGNKLVDFLMPIRGLAMFYNTFDVLQSDKKDRAYYGKIVTPKDTDKVLMRWKVSENEYRVIFGDLHTQTVTAEVLANLEKNLPK